MDDTYTMILWARANHDGTGAQARQVFDMLTILSQVPYLRPKYLTANKKKDVTEFEATLENIEELIMKRRDKKFPQLGSKISFFTSLEDGEASGISICTGVSEDKFLNTVVLDLNVDYKELETERFDELCKVFKQLVGIFRPFYGCIASRSNGDRFDAYYDKAGNCPVSVFDVNYWGEEAASKLAVSSIQGKVFECVEMGNGYYIRLQKEPIDSSNAGQLELQGEVNCLLGI